MRVKEVGANSPHGIYIFDRFSNAWLRLEETSKPLVPSNRYSVLYFDNTKCPACRKYDIYWYPFVKEFVKLYPNYGFYVILCGWFSGDCKSPTASSSFKFFDVRASPTTIFLANNGEKVLHLEKYEGVLTDVELAIIIKGFEDRVKKVMRGEKVESPLRNEETLVDLLKKLLGG